LSLVTSSSHFESLPPTMTAWLTGGGGIDNLQPVTVPVPAPGEHDLLVRIVARSLNYRDLLVINGVADWRPPSPVVPVSDAVGTVIARGPAVTRFRVGDRASAIFLPRWHSGRLTKAAYVTPVGGPINRGMLADYIVVDEDEAAAPPRTLSDAEAATLPIAGVTAWHAVAVRGGVAAGDTVLIHGTGGVALLALQFAQARGARVAITSSIDEKLRRARTLGADLTINYRTSDVAGAVLDWTCGEGADHVVETIGGENLNTSLRAVRIGGNIAFIGLIAGRSAQVDTYEFVAKNVTIHGVETGSREMYEQMAAFIDEHKIRPMIDSIRATTEIRDALRRLECGVPFGRLVLT
jgi:NADPH:quinone reductase-like Zn-dependent oxidoreductase